jgi:hypothetical protein
MMKKSRGVDVALMLVLCASTLHTYLFKIRMPASYQTMLRLARQCHQKHPDILSWKYVVAFMANLLESVLTHSFYSSSSWTVAPQSKEVRLGLILLLELLMTLELTNTKIFILKQFQNDS